MLRQRRTSHRNARRKDTARNQLRNPYSLAQGCPGFAIDFAAEQPGGDLRFRREGACVAIRSNDSAW
eukprot:3247958-Rhodomonas_salina.4